MKKTAIYSLLLLVAYTLGLGTSSAAEPTPVPPEHPGTQNVPRAFKIKNLFQHWVRSDEEERPGTEEQVFRPAESREFPRRRFRMAYKFAENGDCEWLYLAPNDAHTFKTGKWTIDPANPALIQITEDGTKRSYRISGLSKDILRMVPAEPNQRP